MKSDETSETTGTPCQESTGLGARVDATWDRQVGAESCVRQGSVEGDSGMSDPETLKSAQEKADCALFAYIQGTWANRELHNPQLDELKKATKEYLELREEHLRGQWC
jgi:hypothetical protein